MFRSPGTEPGFSVRSALSASYRLTAVIAASLAVGSLSLCLIVAVTVLATRVSLAMPIAG